MSPLHQIAAMLSDLVATTQVHQPPTVTITFKSSRDAACFRAAMLKQADPIERILFEREPGKPFIRLEGIEFDTEVEL